MIYANPYRLSGLIAGFLLLAFGATAQNSGNYLVRGQVCARQGQTDSARYFFRQAYELGDPGQKMTALTERMRLAGQDSETGIGDSLIELAQPLQALVAPDQRIRFKLATGEYYRQSGQYQEAQSTQRRALNESRELPDTGTLRSDARFYLGLAYERLGQYDSSLYYVEAAYEQYRKNLDTNSLKFSEIYNGLANVYYRNNRFAAAKAFYQRSVAILEEKTDGVSSDLANRLNNLSAVARAEGDYEEAIRYSERALQIFRALDDQRGISGAYYALGVYHYFLGDYGRCKDYIQACIQIRSELYGPTHSSLIDPYQLLGIAYEESRAYDRTLDLLRRARPIIRATFGPGSLQEGFNLENTALALQSLGRLDSARHYMASAGQIISPLLPANHYALSTYHFNQANILYETGDLAAAAENLTISNRILAELGLDQNIEYAENLALSALIRGAQNQWTTAEVLFDQALDIISLPEAGELSSSYQLHPTALKVLNEYQRFLFRHYQATGATAVLERYKKSAQQYLALSDAFRQSFTDAYTKNILIADNAEVYQRNMGIFARLYQQQKNPADLAAIYRFSEYSRTCLLRDLQDEKVRTYAGLPDSLLEKERQLKMDISQWYQRSVEFPDSAVVQRALFRAKEALNRHIDLLRTDFPQYYALQYNTQVPDLEVVQASLSTGKQYLEYLRSDTAYYTLLIQPNTVTLHYLGSRFAIDSAVIAWKKAMLQLETDELNRGAEFLYQKLWQPLQADLLGSEVVVIPTGPLFYLNFETLPNGPGSNRLLIHDYTINYAFSLSVLLFEEQNPPPSQPRIKAFAPGFEPTLKQAYREQLDPMAQLDRAYLQTVRQPWSLKLARKVGRQYRSRVFTGRSAHEAQVKREMTTGSILYFGTHAIANAEDAQRSRLVLAKNPGGDSEDGYLHAYELYGLDLDAQLAILNACESGIGLLKAGEGMISLAYSMHFAGCPSTMMSLWKMDERSSTRITEAALEYLRRGRPKGEALRQAKLDYLAQSPDDLQHPFYWAGMVLMGDDEPVPLKGAWPWPWLLSGLALLLILGYFWLVRRKRA